MLLHTFSNCYIAVDSGLPQKLMEKLIEEVKKHSDPTKKKIALTKLLQEIYNNKNLLVVPDYTELPNYEEIYQEALQNTILALAREIDSYQSGQPALPWIKGIFINKFFDALKKYTSKKVRLLSLDTLSYSFAALSRKDPRQNLENFLLKDPENLLKNTRLPGYPHISLQKLLWLILIEDQTWETVAKELDANVSTLSGFYQRNIKKHKAYFQKYLSN